MVNRLGINFRYENYFFREEKMATRSRRSMLAKDDKSKNVSTDSPKTVGSKTTRQSAYQNSDDGTLNTKQKYSFDPLESIYDKPIVTPKKPKTPGGGNRKKLNKIEIENQLISSDDDSCSPPRKNNIGGKKQNEYRCSFVSQDDETIRMKFISVNKSNEIIDCLIGAKENTKVDNRLTDTPRKLRPSMGNTNMNEEYLSEKYGLAWKQRFEKSSRDHKNNKSKAPKNVTEISPRKRSKQNGKQPESEDYGVDENEMSHANQISSPPKRSKSEIGIEKTPKKKTDLADVKSTPKTAAKRKINLSPERNNMNSRRNTRQSTARCTANYKDWSSSDDNITKNGLLEPRVVATKLDQKSQTKRTTRKSFKNIKAHESEESETEGIRNTRSRSKSQQPPAKNVVESPYSPTKDMQKMSLNTPKKLKKSDLIVKLKKVSPSSIQSNTDNSEGTRRKSQRNPQPRYELKKSTDEEEEDADSSDNYEAEDSSEDDSVSSGNDSADEFQAPRTRSRNRMKTPRKNSAASKTNKRISKVSMNTPTKAISRMSLGTPSLDKHRRVSSIIKPSTPLQEARVKLHVSVLPKSLPCREEQFNDIYSFLHARLSDGSGGCIYISGVPGTGKTATVSEVVRCLKKAVTKGELPEFDYIDINGLKLSEPRQAYVQIWKQMSKETKTWEESQKLLHNKFTNSNAKRRMTLLLVDELDMLCTKRQDVVYNLLDWPSKTNAKLVVVTIANTMDLPERILMGKVTSRLGLTRLTFPPYNFKQLEEIVASRLRGFNAFGGETIQLVARKVAAVSGDARRALDICRRSAEIAEKNKHDLVTMVDVKQALDEMIASPKIQAIRGCSDMERYFLQAVCVEVQRTGVEEVVFKNVYLQMETLCRLDGKEAPNVSLALEICARLGAYRLLVTDHSRMDILQRLLLNVSPDDVHFATKNVED